MNITLKLSLQQMKILVMLFNTLKERPTTKVGRARRNILDNLGVKIKKRYIEAASKADLFAPKKYSLKMQYYEAYELEDFISIHELSFDALDENLLLMITHDLNQKLA